MGLIQWETLCGLFFCFFEKIVVPILTSGGYVGLSLGVLLSQHHQVVAVDIVQAKVDMINNKKSPIQDDYIEKYLAEKDLNLTATLDAKAAYSDADFVVIAAPTNYDSKTQHFDTSAVEAVIKLVMEYNILVCSQDFREEDYRGLVDSFEQIEMTRAIGASDLKAIKAVRKLIRKYNPDIVYPKPPKRP